MNTIIIIYFSITIIYIILGYRIMLNGYLSNQSYLSATDKQWKIKDKVASFMFWYSVVITITPFILFIKIIIHG